MTNSNRTLSEAELDLVSGGLWDQPWQDHLNKISSDDNSKSTTFGGAIGGNWMSGGSHGGLIPVDI
jgi:hypothetical protein